MFVTGFLVAMRSSIFTILVLVLAFLAASFPARNSDLWFHLATGRLLAQGQFSFGTDPFAYTTPHVYWACHSWLFDLALYGLRGLIGDAGLIVVKALVVTALAGLLLCIRRLGGAAWLPAVCTTLAIVAICPRLLLQPACVSYLFLGLTFWLLWRQKQRSEIGSGAATPVAYAAGPLLLVFILWANVDEWFFLGPLLAALFWLGERLQPVQCTGSGPRRIPGWLAPAGLAACFLNPYTYHAFTLPAELSTVPWTSGLQDDPRFQMQFASPWNTEYLRAALRLNVAVVSYYALTLLGLATFLLHRPALHDWRLMVWLPFAVLAAWHARLIPFFAVVAAPVIALNAQDILLGKRKQEGGRMKKNGLIAALIPSSLTVLTLLSLLALTWFGWLAGHFSQERHVGWEIQEDPSLRQTAETLERWRRQGLLADSERVFALAPEAAHYGAWFCPGAKHFFDHRYPLFPQAARDYETVCRALLPSTFGPGPKQEADWQRILRDYKIGIVIFYDRDPQRLFSVLNHLADDPEHWTLLHVAGQALIAGWNEARSSLPPSDQGSKRRNGFAALALDPERMAFGPQDAKTQQDAMVAPEQGPTQLPPRRDFWAKLTRLPAAPAWESAAAALYLHYFQVRATAERQQKWQFLWSAYAAGLAGFPAQAPAITQAASQLWSSRELLFQSDAVPQFLVREQLGPFFVSFLERSPALPLLAIRAARRAVAANPEDAHAWLRLGQAYLLLHDLTCEHSVSPERLPPLTQLRHVQIVAALEQAVRLDPDLETAHHELAFLYGAGNALDQSLEHRQQEVRLSHRTGARPGETAEEFAYRMEHLDKDLAKLVKLVQHQREEYEPATHSFQGDRLAQARLALQLGLARQAVDEVLLPAPADLLGAAGMRLELELLLSLGRVQEVRDILNDQRVRASKHGLGNCEYQWPAYEWLHALAAAAAGDYAQAREDLRTIRTVKQAERDLLQQQTQTFERGSFVFLPNLLSGSLPFVPAFTALALGRALEERTVQERTLRGHQADLCVLEGLLALEQGDTGTARFGFAEAEKIAGADSFAGQPITAGYFSKLTAK